MQQHREPDPFRVVWPVGPDQPQREPAGSTTETPVMLSEEILLRHRARIMDPTRSWQPGARRRERENRPRKRRAGAPIPYQPTAYVADEILVSATGRGAGELRDLTESLNGRLKDPGVKPVADLRLVPNEADLEMLDRRVESRSPAAVRLWIESAAAEAAQVPDAFWVVQTLRDLLLADGSDLEVGLNHLMFASGLGGVGFTFGHGVGGIGFTFGHATGPAEYAVPGLGGRSPVRWVGPPPHRGAPSRRPVVAILDTGVDGTHPWFQAPAEDPIVVRMRYVPETGQVVPDDVGGGELDPNLVDPLEGILDPFFGHGTFIAGLINTTCPDARIVSIKLMGTDGIATESALLNSLGHLHERQFLALASGQESDLIDVISLSLGYYSESGPGEMAYDRRLRDVVESLGRLGVLVVAAAGNNATTTPLLPAGFCPFVAGVLSAGSPDVPMVSVGALNPDDSVALFSNAGDWIACHSPGAALVSTLPIVDVGQRSGVDLGVVPLADRPVASWRATIDPDSFTGFGTWSGTSFAAPVVAGTAAQAMLERATAEPHIRGAARGRRALQDLGFDLTPA